MDESRDPQRDRIPLMEDFLGDDCRDRSPNLKETVIDIHMNALDFYHEMARATGPALRSIKEEADLALSLVDMIAQAKVMATIVRMYGRPAEGGTDAEE